MEIDKNALDRYITGNWGEDQFIGDPTNAEHEPEPLKVFISTGGDSEWIHLWDAYTGEQLSTRPEKLRHNLIELATSEGWEVVDGPLWDESENGDSFDYPDDDPGFDPKFLM